MSPGQSRAAGHFSVPALCWGCTHGCSMETLGGAEPWAWVLGASWAAGKGEWCRDHKSFWRKSMGWELKVATIILQLKPKCNLHMGITTSRFPGRGEWPSCCLQACGRCVSGGCLKQILIPCAGQGPERSLLNWTQPGASSAVPCSISTDMFTRTRSQLYPAQPQSTTHVAPPPTGSVHGSTVHRASPPQGQANFTIYISSRKALLQ